MKKFKLIYLMLIINIFNVQPSGIKFQPPMLYSNTDIKNLIFFNIFICLSGFLFLYNMLKTIKNQNNSEQVKKKGEEIAKELTDILNNLKTQWFLINEELTKNSIPKSVVDEFNNLKKEINILKNAIDAKTEASYNLFKKIEPLANLQQNYILGYEKTTTDQHKESNLFLKNTKELVNKSFDLLLELTNVNLSMMPEHDGSKNAKVNIIELQKKIIQFKI